MAQPIYASTELEAINVMLEAIGSEPAASLSVSVNSDVNHAKSILKETIREILEQGWDFNTDTKYALSKTVNDEYVVPLNVAAIDVSEDYPEVRATYRNGKMWDQENHTFTWDKDITFDIVWLFPFEELPQVARHYITMVAARKMQGRLLGSDNAGKYTENDEMQARAAFIDAEAIDAKHNILSGNYSVARVLNRMASVPAVRFSWR
jgi:hypothetical protein